MVQLPKNCKLIYGNTGVFLKVVYATTLSVGEHDGVTVFKSSKSNKRLLELNSHITYQYNLPMKIKDAYYELKKKAMLFNRMQKQQILQREIEELANSSIPGIRDIAHLKYGNQLPLPPDEIHLDDLPY